jgi:hypothetical protein
MYLIILNLLINLCNNFQNIILGLLADTTISKLVCIFQIILKDVFVLTKVVLFVLHVNVWCPIMLVMAVCLAVYGLVLYNRLNL